jgi:hypothetical protein
MFEVLGLGNTEFKILALPEHFSPEQLQMIVDGKLKDGDKVLVECDDKWVKVAYSMDVEKFNKWVKVAYSMDVEKFIKLNSSNHITLYKVEEKMYTREELISIGRKLAEYVYLNDINSNEMVEKWFEQNVK